MKLHFKEQQDTQSSSITHSMEGNLILSRCGFYPHVQKAEQMIKHGHYLLNDKCIFSMQRMKARTHTAAHSNTQDCNARCRMVWTG
jgi:ribosomal protein S4